MITRYIACNCEELCTCKEQIDEIAAFEIYKAEMHIRNEEYDRNFSNRRGFIRRPRKQYIVGIA